MREIKLFLLNDAENEVGSRTDNADDDYDDDADDEDDNEGNANGYNEKIDIDYFKKENINLVFGLI